MTWVDDIDELRAEAIALRGIVTALAATNPGPPTKPCHYCPLGTAWFAGHADDCLWWRAVQATRGQP